MKPITAGESYVFCRVCNVAGGGIHQVKRHCHSKWHVNRRRKVTWIKNAGELEDILSIISRILRGVCKEDYKEVTIH